MQNKIYFIAAPPRSGTSFLASLLSVHGVWVGPSVPADQDNKFGYYENKRMVTITKQVLKRNGRRARSDELPIKKFKYSPDLIQEFGKIVPKNRDWLYKDSKLLLIWPLFVRAFPEAIWILPDRDEDSIYASLMRCRTWYSRRVRQDLDRAHFYKMIDRLKAEQVRIAEKVGKSVQVNTTSVIESKEAAQSFLEQCGVSFDEALYEEVRHPEAWHG